MNVPLALAVVVCAASVFVRPAQADGGTLEQNERVTKPLIDAGIGLDRESLIRALRDARAGLAVRAAMLLGRMPQDGTTLNALRDASQSNQEAVALSAMISLSVLGDPGWLQTGRKALESFQDPALRIDLAAALGRSNVTDGWPLIRDCLFDEQCAILVLGYIATFEGKEFEGSRISVQAALQQALGRTSNEQLRQKIRDTLDRLSAANVFEGTVAAKRTETGVMAPKSASQAASTPTPQHTQSPPSASNRAWAYLVVAAGLALGAAATWILVRRRPGG